MCQCKARAKACGCNGGRVPVGFQPAPFPINFPSALQADMSARDPNHSAVQPRSNGLPVATGAVVRPNPGRGKGIDRRNPDPWHTLEVPKWGSVSPIRWGHLIGTATSSRVQVAPMLYQTNELRPMTGTPRVRRNNYPALDSPQYNVNRKVTEGDLEALAKARQEAQARAAKRGFQ
jgi:hypothetical protein